VFAAETLNAWGGPLFPEESAAKRSLGKTLVRGEEKKNGGVGRRSSFRGRKLKHPAGGAITRSLGGEKIKKNDVQESTMHGAREKERSAGEREGSSPGMGKRRWRKSPEPAIRGLRSEKGVVASRKRGLPNGERERVYWAKVLIGEDTAWGC